MEFLGIGYQEVLLVLALLLIVVGPQRMPEVAYQIGRAVREMQKYARAVRDEFREEFDYLDAQARELRGEVNAASRDLDDVRRSLRTESRQLDRDLKEATAPIQEALPAGKAEKNGTNAARPAGSTLSSARVSSDASTDGNKDAAAPANGTRGGGESEPAGTSENGKATTDRAEPAADEQPGKPPLVF